MNTAGCGIWGPRRYFKLCHAPCTFIQLIGGQKLPLPRTMEREARAYSIPSNLSEATLKAAKALQIGHPAGRHIFLCSDQTTPKCCSKESSLEAWNYLKRRVKELGLEQTNVAAGRGPVLRTKANCLRLCANGPVAVVYPDGVWYHSCTPDVLEQIITRHLMKGELVEEYIIPAISAVKHQ